MNKGFDNEKYLDAQVSAILDRVDKFSKMYLEFGGKLLTDYHAARVLPGYEYDAKTRLLKQLKDKSELIYCVCAKDLQKGRMRYDLGLSYDALAIKELDDIRKRGLRINSVVITRFEGGVAAKRFKTKLKNMGETVYLGKEIPGYPKAINKVVSEDGYGIQPHIETKRELVIVTGAGGGSGKMSVCLSQLYHDNKNGGNTGYAKFETFPIWNLPLSHPVNLAYEAATADLGDYNFIDPYHKEAYGIKAVNYNRDVENFEIMKTIMEKIVTEDNYVAQYKSPTDMGVNMAKIGISDNDVICEAGKQEIIRRYFRYRREFYEGVEPAKTLDRMAEIMKKAGVTENDRKVVVEARRARNEAQQKKKSSYGHFKGAAIQLHDGTIITGKGSDVLYAVPAAVLNAIKHISHVPDDILLLPEPVLISVQKMKQNVLGLKYECLDLEETLITLALSTAANPVADRCMKNLPKLKNCEMHITARPCPGDEAGLRKLMMNVTVDVKIPQDNK